MGIGRNGSVLIAEIISVIDGIAFQTNIPGVERCREREEIEPVYNLARRVDLPIILSRMLAASSTHSDHAILTFIAITRPFLVDLGA
ncbi:hypothetical protein HG421_10030 [Xanthomonas campestris pv. badrii]|uniref:Uncharacterized protein n=1 Tax=Xanthomonas campestris pv. badrii TaxID=149696 RepID=A0A7Z2VAJ2_XANCA|nr:hypothetical protein [Xanthomonas campestris]MCC4604793.1 hypothetical protein [Xanthomonas campestris pv. parthenii]QJD68019.1 hypothetical protein HG421_10030 [Xanthomonas campestris pv. badrii]